VANPQQTTALYLPILGPEVITEVMAVVVSMVGGWMWVGLVNGSIEIIEPQFYDNHCFYQLS